MCWTYLMAGPDPRIVLHLAQRIWNGIDTNSASNFEHFLQRRLKTVFGPREEESTRSAGGQSSSP